MRFNYKWKPSKSRAREFAREMERIDEFCRRHGIDQSASSDSYYFTLNGKKYRVSNHTMQQSNRKAFDELTRERIRRSYHNLEEEADTICITASKTRIIEIYEKLKAGYKLDKRGYIIY